jgi:hypothetical protein
MGFIGITAAIALPGLTESTRRNAVWTSSELIGAQIRQARLKAISRNMSFRVRFNCPAVGQFRVLQVTGDAAIDNAADRCSTQQTYDTGVFAVNSNIYWGGSPPVLTVNSRGVLFVIERYSGKDVPVVRRRRGTLINVVCNRADYLWHLLITATSVASRSSRCWWRRSSSSLAWCRWRADGDHAADADARQERDRGDSPGAIEDRRTGWR